MPLPREYLSFNQIKQYINCPRQYYFSYIKEIRQPVNDKIFLGILFHSVVENIIRNKIEGTPLSKDEVNEHIEERADSLKQSIEVDWNGNESKAFKRGTSFVRYFYREILPEISPIMTEKEFSAVIPETNTVLKGVIDLVEEDFSITDFKTTTSKWSPSRARDAFLQLYIYKYLFESNLKGSEIKRLKFRILFSKSENNCRTQLFETVPEIENTDKMFSIIRNVESGIADGNFSKNEGYICNMCSYKDICKSSPSVV